MGSGDEHRIVVAGARVRICDGRVEVLSDPLVRRCPVRSRLYGHSVETRETVEMSVRENIEGMGMFTPDRVLEFDGRAVTFGASEIMADALEEGTIDCAVVIADGAGTVIVDRPEVLEAIGAHMTGVESTTPIPEVVDGLVSRGVRVLDPPGMDQLEGIRCAARGGMRRIAVTVSGAIGPTAGEARRLGDSLGARLSILSVHNTEADDAAVADTVASADIVWPCASGTMRGAMVGANLQVGTGVPVFALTGEGRRLVLARLVNMDSPMLVSKASLPVVDEIRVPERDLR